MNEGRATELAGGLSGAGLKICVVAARWNAFVTDSLLEGAVATLHERGVADEAVTIVRVPGAFEVPTAAKWAAESGRFDAIICIGAVIRGDTAHFEYVAGGAADGILTVSLATGVPVVFGVLTVDTKQQALDRAGGSEGHKGSEAADTAIEMAQLRKKLA